MRSSVCSVAALLALAVVFAPGAARGDVITPMFFDGFEADPADVLNASLVNWNVISGSIDVLSGGNLCGPSGNYTHCVDLDGTSTQAGTIQTKQTFTLDPGTYRLTFDLAGANRPWTGSASNTVFISLGAYFSEAFTPLQWDPFYTFTRDITVYDTGNAKVQFSHMGGDMIGLLLDNVSLAHVVAEEPNVIPTPEPGSWELIASTLGLLVWRFRKKRS